MVSSLGVKIVEWFVWAFGITVALIFVLALLIMRIEIDYQRRGEVDALMITISTMARLIRIKRKFPVQKWDADQPRGETKKTHALPSDTSWWGRRMTMGKSDIYQSIKIFLSKVHCERLTWHSTVGTGDAAEAGTLTGLAWSIKTTTLGWVTRYIKMRTVPELDVTPDFNHPRLDTHIHCIVKFRLGDAILAGIRILFHTKKGTLKNRLTQTKRSETV